VGAEQVWWDPTTNTLSVRDAGNAAWVAVTGGTPGLAAVLDANPDATGIGITNLGQTIRNAAGVPAGAPTGTELPIAVDTTASPGTLYFWDGAAWAAIV
jgi:hypothetical protein